MALVSLLIVVTAAALLAWSRLSTGKWDPGMLLGTAGVIVTGLPVALLTMRSIGKARPEEQPARASRIVNIAMSVYIVVIVLSLLVKLVHWLVTSR
jgi:hypothetical protein